MLTSVVERNKYPDMHICCGTYSGFEEAGA